MKITRTINGTDYEFELSDHELVGAFQEQDRKYDTENLQFVLEHETCKAQKINEEDQKEIINEYRCIMENDSSWISTMKGAIALVERKKRGGITI